MNQSTIKVAIISLAFYIPSHDMLVSILMEVRFEKSGMVRTRSFEVLPFQIYVAGESENEDVLYRSKYHNKARCQEKTPHHA